MRAFALEHFGDAPGVRDLPIPETADACLIRVRCAGVNPIDYMFAVGDRVCGLARSYGSYAEFTTVAPRVKIEPLWCFS